MKDILGSLFFVLGIAFPALLAFRVFFSPSNLVGGDAPYFYSEQLHALVSEPYGWTSWGNNLGGPNLVLWLTPIMLAYGALHLILGISNDIIIRFLFYLPAIIGAFVGPIVLVRYLGYSRLVGFFASLLYGLNTYFLLLIDGGQVGVALAYGIFPFTLWGLRRLAGRAPVERFLIALLLVVLLSMADVRIAVIAVITIIVWLVVEALVTKKFTLLRYLLTLYFLSLATLFIGSYWFISLTIFVHQDNIVSSSVIHVVSLLDSLFLFQPHWPLNEFGKVSSPPFYFVGIPLLIFSSVLFSKTKSILIFAFCFLLFAFFTKGNAPPLGFWYEFLSEKLPFGVAFRDSTKFFAPLLLFGGVLIGTTIDGMINLLGKKLYLSHALVFLVYLYLLFLIHPAILGKLNWVLSARAASGDFNVIYERLRSEGGFFRTVWFPERHPLSFHTEEKPALDAKKLIDNRPFAALNVGISDLFNFLHDSQFSEWFNLLGIRYLVFSGDPRRVDLNKEEQENWNNLLSLVATRSGLIKENWGTSFPVYRVPETKPRIFAVDKLIGVVGTDDIYKELARADEKFSVGNQAFVFFEDGKFDPRNLQEVASDSAILVFNKTDEIGLTMSFLQDYFIGATKAVSSGWAVRSTHEYLKWKYELLIRGIDTKEFDYKKGIAFSTVTGEEISFNVNVPQDDEYVLVTRTMRVDNNELLELDFLSNVPIINSSIGEFEWYVRELGSLKKRKYKITFKNNGGIHVFNVVALIPKKDWEEAKQLTRNFLGHFGVIKIDGVNDEQDFRQIVGTKWTTVGYDQINPVRYKVTLPQSGRWIVFIDSYHPSWMFKKGAEFFPSYPLYSMINGFYVDPRWQQTEIVFRQQENVRWGLYFSAVSVLLLAVIFLWYYAKRYD